MDDKLKQIQKLLDAAEGNLHSARNLLRDMLGAAKGETLDIETKAKDLSISEEGKIIEGVYNGEAMVAPDGKEYPVPANYASKSKLVEGDVLKLTIAEDGSFIFKQINPVERTKTIGTLAYSSGNYVVNADGKTYKVLQASVTYYRGEPGDQVTIIIPKDHESAWAAIENIVKKIDQPGGEATPTDQPNTDNEIQEKPAELTVEPPEAKEEPIIEFPKEDNGPVFENVPAGPIEPIIAPTPEPAVAEATGAVTPPPAAEPVVEQKPDEGIKELDI